MNILLLLGIVLLASLLAGQLAHRFGVPQVVAYIVVGILIGESGLKLFHGRLVDAFSPLIQGALAMIGFMVGGELKLDVFKKYGSQFLAILLCEGCLAMAAVFALTLLWTGNPAIAVLLGALSSATAPAATVDVLWEYRTSGPLTTSILAIVALDDGLALILYGFAFAFADMMVAGGQPSLYHMLFEPLLEIVSSLTLGCVAGFLLDRGLLLLKKKEDNLVVNIGAIFLTGGLAAHLDLSLIMVSMAMGIWLTNASLHRNERSFETVKNFAPPVYIIFFVLVGARLQVGLLSQMGIISLLYIIGRTAGKWSGAYMGARLSGAPAVVRNYLGLALFSQAGVALGLALDIYQHFSQYGAEGRALGENIINVIAATTFVVQIIGPPSVKLAVKKAGEITVD